MAVTITQGDIFTATTDVITNPVNCVGVMGKGLALEFKSRYPDLLHKYQTACETGTLRVGRAVLVRQPTGPHIVLFPTKHHWRDRSSEDEILAGVRMLAQQVSRWGIGSIAIPALGCGLGGLNWGLFKATLVEELERVPADVMLYEPDR
jgi:O-acetyl-ADP-ribose deacetylase (regulator of RNase III)